MKVGELIDLLEKMNPDADVIIHKDVMEYGYGYLDRITPGMFVETDYGNDFFPNLKMILSPEDIRAICFYAEIEPKKD